MIHLLLIIAAILSALMTWAAFELGGEVLRGRPSRGVPVNAYRFAGFVLLIFCVLCWRVA